MDALWKHYGIPMASPNEVRLTGCYNLAHLLYIFAFRKLKSSYKRAEKALHKTLVGDL